MSDPQSARHLVINHQNQPVELHLPSGLVVLPPRGQAVVSEADLAAPQLRVLCSGRQITTHEVAPAAEPGDAAEVGLGAQDDTPGGDVPEPEPDAGRNP